MTVDRINLKQKFPTFQFLNMDIGFEGSIEPGEDIMKALETLQNVAQSFHKQQFPHFYTESGKPITVDPVPEDLPPSKEQGLIQVIQLCISVTALERFRPQVEALNNIQVTEVFSNKMKNLKGEHN